MTNWRAGDIITDKKWDKLNKVYPFFKKVNITDITGSNPTYTTLDINYDEFIELKNNGDVLIWAQKESGDLQFFDSIYISYEATNDEKTLCIEYSVA